MGNIKIENTDRFDELTTYLKDNLTYVDELETKLNDIGKNTSGSVRTVYNNSSSSAKQKIKSAKDSINKAISHITSALGVYYTADDELGKKLNEVYDDIFDDKEYENKYVYLASGEDKKISYEEFIELVNSSDEYFKKQKEKVYDEFLTKMVTSGPAMLKKLGINIFNAVVENAYFCISDQKPGSYVYKKELDNFKRKFGKNILNQYDNLDFIPKCYMKTNEYNKALLALTFDDKDFYQKQNMILKTFNEIDEKTKQKTNDIFKSINNIDIFYQAKDIFTDAPSNVTTKELLEYYTNEVKGIQMVLDLTNKDEIVIFDYTYNPNYDAWYDTIKNTEAFKKIKKLLPDDKYEIYKLTNSKDFLSAVYQYDGMDALQGVYSNYIGKCTGQNPPPKEYIINGNLENIVQYSTINTVLNTLYQPLMDTNQKLKAIKESEKTSLLLFAKDLDTSDVTNIAYQNALKDVDNKWKNYCNGDYTQYLEEWQLKAYAKILEHDKDLANRLFNNSEGGDRGILNDKIMEGYAFDVAKDRVQSMALDNDNGTIIDEYLRSVIFSSAFGFGYGVTDFTSGIVDAIAADGKANRRQMEKNNIIALLSGDYSLQRDYYNKDPKVMEMFSTNYPDEYINKLKLKNFSREDIDSFINDCKENKVPRYELEYYMGNISYDEFVKYQSIANLDNKDLEFYAKLQDSPTTKWLADKSFKIGTSVGTMAIPTLLSIIATATGPVGGIPISTTCSLLSSTSTVLSYASLLASSFGRNREGLMQSGETNNAYILTNALLNAAFETFGEMALGKILKPTKVTEFLKETTAKNHPVLGAIFNASDNFEVYLLKNNCNPELAKYFSGIVGEVIQENTENIFGHGIDITTQAIFKKELEVPSLKELVEEAWETTWVTALTTPVLKGMTNISLSNIPRYIDINGETFSVSLSDLLRFTNEETNQIDYKGLTKHLGISDRVIVDEVLDSLDTYSKVTSSRYGEFGLDSENSWQKYQKHNIHKQEIFEQINELIDKTNIKIKGVTGSNHYIIETPSGKLLEITESALISQNFYNEMLLDGSEGNLSLLVNDWILDQVADMDKIMMTKTDLDKSSQEVLDEQIKGLAKRLNITPEEAQRLLDNKIKQLYDDSDVGIRVSNQVLKLILESGFKNQHETHSSDGANVPEARKAFESYFMGLAKIDDADSPVYGNLFPSKDADLDTFVRYAKSGPGRWYGSGSNFSTEVVALLDKNKTINYTTLTLGDSLNYSRRGNLPDSYKGYEEINYVQSPTAAANPHFTGAPDTVLRNIDSVDKLKNIDLFDLTNGPGGDEYIETQLYGHENHGVDIIKELVFLSEPDIDTKMRLDELSIPYTIIK